MNILKVYLYDKSVSGYRGTNYTNYVLQGTGNVERLNQEVDASTITLQGLSFREEFTPQTRFVIDECEDDTIIHTWHRVVQQDTVSQPILSNNNYFTHILSLEEPSIIAQQRLDDNFSCTYKLKDVNFETQTTLDLTRDANEGANNTYITPDDKFGKFEDETHYVLYKKYTKTFRFGKHFYWASSDGGSTLLDVVDENGANKSHKYYNLMSTYVSGSDSKIKFVLPKVSIYVCNKNTTNYSFQGWAGISWVIKEYAPNSDTPTTKASGSIKSNSTFNADKCAFPYSNHISTSTDLSKYCMLEYVEDQDGIVPSSLSVGVIPQYYFKQYSSSDGVSIGDLGTQYTDLITVQDGYTYTCEVSLYEYTNDLPNGGTYSAYAHKTSDITMYCQYTTILTDSSISGIMKGSVVDSAKKVFAENLYMNTEITMYSASTITQVLASGTPYNALNLIKKAILCSKLIPKRQVNSGGVLYSGNVACTDIQHTNASGGHDFSCCPFYIDENFVNELALTQVNENFYNQKNLWEVLIEIGYYIHAIPEIKFGDNDKFMITFNKLGETDVKSNVATKTSIMNFRGVDDYISATSSYITNMVQLGGQITEYVAPKTLDERYIVSNDTATIKTSKPIIELLSIKIIPLTTQTFESPYNSLTAGTEYDITNYVYEKNVYDILSMRYNDNPNKGIAIYYELGASNIVGCSYQLPQENTNMYSDYALKKIIFLSNNSYPTPSTIPTSGPWSAVKVNNFVFKITYRTKDDVRQQHVRPDLKKYLLNSGTDFAPQHNQFNNQEDTLVDSVSFGQKMYGTLIRTGNTNYQETEWVDGPTGLKHKGELYNLYGDLYYVSQVSNTYYSDHIISQVEYSKDYNQLSQVIGIPSEPRFYEISEQSSIRRDVNIQDYLVCSTNSSRIAEVANDSQTFLYDINHLMSLIFKPSVEFAKWVLTTFKGDKDIGSDYGTFGESTLVKHVLTPLNAYSSGTTLTYEWDMVDNFGAGDYISDVVAPTTGTEQEKADNAYNTLRSFQYCDTYGKATLMDFYILEDYSIASTDIKNLPQSPINVWDGTTNGLMNKKILATNIPNPISSDTEMHQHGLILLKDCREAISLNYNLSFITDDDYFVPSPYLFSPNKSSISLVFLNKEVSKLSNGYIDQANVINVKDDNGTIIGNSFTLTDYDFLVGGIHSNYGITANSEFEIAIRDKSSISTLSSKHFQNGEFEQIKSVVIICDILGDDISVSSKKKFVLARNVPSTFTKTQALANWCFGNPASTFFQ